MLILIDARLQAQEWDYLDVDPGYETLNLAIEGDTLNGAPKSLNRVYRLQRGGMYLYNGSIQNNFGATIRIEAAEGEGDLPLIIPISDNTGNSYRFFLGTGDAYFTNLAISGIDNLGNVTEQNMCRLNQEGMKLYITGCFLDYDLQSFVRMNASGQSVFITNSVLRNSINPVSTGNGRFVDTRGLNQDTISITNSTLYITAQHPIRSSSSIINQVILDHVTIYGSNGDNGGYDGIESGSTESGSIEKTEGIIQIQRAINCRITNSLFVDCGFEGCKRYLSNPADTIKVPLIPIDSLRTDDPTAEANRVWDISNNVYGWSSDLEEWFSYTDSSYKLVFLNQYADEMFSMYPTMQAYDNLEEYVVFTDGPSSDALVTFAQYKEATENSDVDNPEITADKNGVAALNDDPDSFGPADEEFDFTYNTDSEAYTFAKDGTPVGDL
jgi:hypothetical protein